MPRGVLFVSILLLLIAVSTAEEECSCSCSAEKELGEKYQKQLLQNQNDFKEAETKLIVTQQTLSETESTLSNLKTELKDTKEKLQSLEKELSKSRSTHTKELKYIQDRADSLEQQLHELAIHHQVTWLPHWLDQSLGKVKNSTEKYVAAANNTWQQHGVPLMITSLNTANRAFITSKDILTRYWTSFVESSFYASLKSYSADVYAFLRSYNVIARVDDEARAATRQFNKVFVELETAVIKFAGKYPQLAVFTEKPLSAVAVWLLLLSPALALFVAVFANTQSSARAPSSTETGKKKKGKGKQQNAYSSDGASSATKKLR